MLCCVDSAQIALPNNEFDLLLTIVTVHYRRMSTRFHATEFFLDILALDRQRKLEIGLLCKVSNLKTTEIPKVVAIANLETPA